MGSALLVVCVEDDGSGLPLRRVELELETQRAVTGRDGCASVEIPEGTWGFRVHREGYSSITVENVQLSSGQTRRLYVQLREARAVCTGLRGILAGEGLEDRFLRWNVQDLPLERGLAAPWSRGEASHPGSPPAVLLQGTPIAGPGERVPSLPRLVPDAFSVRDAPEVSLWAAPGGRAVQMELPSAPGAGDNRIQVGNTGVAGWAGKNALDSAVAVGMDGRGADQVWLGSAHSWGGPLMLSLLGVASPQDALLRGEVIRSHRDHRLAFVGLARRWTTDGLEVDRLSGELQGETWLGGVQLEASARQERHGEVGRTSGALELGVSSREALEPRVGLRVEREVRAGEERLQLAPRAQVRVGSASTQLILAAASDAGQWAPERAGVDVLPARTLLVQLGQAFPSELDAWTSLAHVRQDGVGEILGSAGLRRRGLLLEGTLALSGWSAATGAYVLYLQGDWAPQLGLSAIWRSKSLSPPPGAEGTLPFTPDPHADGAIRWIQPVPLGAVELALEGAAHARWTPGRAPSPPVFELVARARWGD